MELAECVLANVHRRVCTRQWRAGQGEQTRRLLPQARVMVLVGLGWRWQSGLDLDLTKMYFKRKLSRAWEILEMESDK